MKFKFLFLIVIFCFASFANAAFEAYDTLTFGGFTDVTLDGEIFGKDSSWNYAATGFDNKIVGGWATTNDVAKEAIAISAFIRVTPGYANLTCALYEYVDYSSSYAGNLVGQTESKYMTKANYDWETFMFESTTNITPNTKYYIVIWGDTNVDIGFTNGGANTEITATKAYTGTYPDPLTGDTNYVNKILIYCTYLTAENITYTSDATNVAETTATLNGITYMTDDSTCGFWIGDETTAEGTYEQNVTCVGTYATGEEFSKDVTGLTSGQYYYVRAWTNSATGGFVTDSNESYLLTLPNSPTGLTKVNASYEQIGLRWINATVGVDNLTTIIRYKTTGYPSSITDGILGYNGTGNNTLITGLQIDTTYYFGAWHYCNASGSPFKTAHSTSYATASGETEGGLYNINVKYEDNQTNVSNTVMSAFVHHCDARLKTGEILNSTIPTTNPFPMNCTQTPDVFRFDFKNRTLWRTITPESGTRNITFYVSDRPEYETGLNATECQLWYTFNFNDYTNYFASSNESKLYIYKYNGTTKYYIHQDYWSSEDTVDASLQYGDRYYLGVWCPTVYIPFLQYFDAHETTAPYITITYEQLTESNINAYVNVNFTWAGGGHGIWVNYTDGDFNTNSVSLYIYQMWRSNGTLILRNQTNWTTDLKNYRWTQVAGCNNTSMYYIVVEIDHARFETNQTINALLVPYTTAITNPYWIEDYINSTIGESPFIDTDPDSFTYGQYIEWTHILAFGACLVLLMTIGHINMPLSMIGVGILLVVLEAILGIVVTRSVLGSSVGILGGVLMIILGIIVFIGGEKQ